MSGVEMCSIVKMKSEKKAVKQAEGKMLENTIKNKISCGLCDLTPT